MAHFGGRVHQPDAVRLSATFRGVLSGESIYRLGGQESRLRVLVLAAEEGDRGMEGGRRAAAGLGAGAGWRPAGRGRARSAGVGGQGRAGLTQGGEGGAGSVVNFHKLITHLMIDTGLVMGLSCGLRLLSSGWSWSSAPSNTNLIGTEGGRSSTSRSIPWIVASVFRALRRCPRVHPITLNRAPA
jgi:hypothetical protein